MMKLLFTFSLLIIGNLALGQESPASKKSQSIELSKFRTELVLKNTLNKQEAYKLASKSNFQIFKNNQDGSIKRLIKLDNLGLPIYYQTFNNLDAAITTNTTKLYPNGGLGLEITGSSEILRDKFAIWDGGAVYSIHQEFIGRIFQMDTAKFLSDHATHVSGTLIAKGINPVAKGMAYNSPNLLTFDFDNDIVEAADFANSLLISNHSYGYLSGWNFVNYDNNSRWEWYGEKGKSEDYKFGFYDSETANWDNISYLSPYYLQVKSAGNSRSSNGPPIGSPYYVYDNDKKDFVLIPARDANISNNDNFDIITPTNTGKNILTVGAVFPIINGYMQPSDVKISRFSSWGPTDDGRIKPDIVADGMSVYSTSSKSPNAYAYKNGTSMAAPNVSGSLLLLQELYAQKNNNQFMLASTLKGLAIHTAAEAGTNEGPDYVYGWGLMNTEEAAKVILGNKINTLIFQDTLFNQNEKSYIFDVSEDAENLKITSCWTDPPGEPGIDGQIDNNTSKLVNDLDIRLYDNGVVYLPWVLDPTKPENAALKGDNNVDNVEQIVVHKNPKTKNFILTIKSKRPLKDNKQVFSVIISGIKGNLNPYIIEEDLDISLYPNPACNAFNISLLSRTEKQLDVNIFNSIGSKVYQFSSKINGVYYKNISTQNFNNGVYFLEINLGGEKTLKKLLIRK